MMIDRDDYRVYLVKLPSTVYGAVRVDRDGFYSIYINNTLTEEKQRETMAHEIRHIERGDHYNSLTIAEAEGMKQITKESSGFRGRGQKRMTDDMWLHMAIMMQKLSESETA